MSYLSRINSSADLRKLSLRELNDLAGEIREEIIRVVTRQGGHLSPNLGVVELTLALHYVFNTPEDKLIWDVGHQCYTHKIITGRRHLFSTLRQYQGLSGFPKREESEFDVFDSGHSGDAIGVGVGMATALRLAGKQSPRVIVVIGDGSLASGVAFEGLNYCGQKKLNIIIILNDNEMSIARSDGALATYLNRLITGQVYNRLKNDVWNLLGLLPDNLTSRAREMAKRLKEGLKNLFVPSLIFEELGFRYFGPLDGHNLKTLINTFHQIKILTGPILVHVVTKKGKGYPPAEEDPEFFHGIGGSVVHNRCPLTECEAGTKSSKERSVTFSEVFGSVLLRIAERDPKVVVITPGMCLGSGLRMFRERFPGRFFDCGICEQFALNFASGLALSGLKPVVAIYSPFLPRAYDQLIYNICLQNLPVLFAIDRAGVSGEDGETHQGIFDLSFLRFLPNITIIAPKDGKELETAMTWAIENLSSPIAIRYPKGLSLTGDSEREIKDFAYGRGVIEKEGKDFCLIGIGYGVNLAHEVAKELEEEGYSSAVVNARFVKPLDGELFSDLARRFSLLFTIEENTFEGGFGSALLEFYEDKGLPVRVIRFGLPSAFLPHGDRKIILRRFGLEAKALAKRIKEIIR
jgi:1-deoxy-D-xylulose-5-phosphate synthase